MEPHPCGEDFPKWLRIYLPSIYKLALDDEDALFGVIYYHGINLFVVSSVGNVVACCGIISQQNSPEVPSDEPLTVIGEVSLVERVRGNLLGNLLEHVRSHLRL